MKKAIFFNMFRNGDLFVVREFTRSLVYQLPEYNWYYAHGNHPNSLADMPYKYLPMPHFHEVCASVGCTSHEMSDILPKYKPLEPNEVLRNWSVDSPLYINTWAGCFHGSVFPRMTYPNMHDLLQIWKNISILLYQKTNTLTTFDKNIIEYFPKVNHLYFDSSLITYAHKKINGYSKKWLIANGKSMSGQSQLNSEILNQVIINLAVQNKDIVFICTEKFPHDLNNIYFTTDLFVKSFDLPEISVFSQFCDVIIGKNSGPFTYCHTHSNILDNTKTFISFSNLERDNLLYNISDKKCSFFHSNATEYSDVLSILNNYL